jgi:hypothetical protein
MLARFLLTFSRLFTYWVSSLLWLSQWNQSRWFNCCRSIWVVRFQERIGEAWSDLTRLGKSSLVHGFEGQRAATWGDCTSWIGESRTATRSRWVGSTGLGIVKESKQEGIMVSKVFISRAIESGFRRRGGEGKKGCNS